MSRSDTEADIIYADRPRYQVGSEVVFMANPQTQQYLVGRVALSRQLIHHNGTRTVTYDINTTSGLWSSIPEDYVQNYVPQKRSSR